MHEFCSTQYAERKIATGRAVSARLMARTISQSRVWPPALPGVPYCANSIRRADTSDQSRGPNGLIYPPAFQNELAPGTAGRAVLLDCRQAKPTRHEFGSRPCRAFPAARIPYAERELATGREVLLDYRQAKPTRHEFGSRLTCSTRRRSERRPWRC